MRGCLTFVLCLLSGLVLAFICLLSCAWFYHAYPSSHVLFAGLVVMVGGTVLGIQFFRRLRRYELRLQEEQRTSNRGRCHECGEWSRDLSWSSYRADRKKNRGRLCPDCQEHYRAKVER